MTHSIDVTAAGVTIDGTTHTSFSVSALTDIFGKPRIVPPTDPEPDSDGQVQNTWYIWDEAGVSVSAQPDKTSQSIWIRLCEDAAREAKRAQNPSHTRPTATGLFPGALTVDGQPALEAVAEKDLRLASIAVTAEVGNWEVFLYLNSTELESVTSMSYGDRYAKRDTNEIADLVRAASNPIAQVLITYVTPAPTRPKTKKSSGKWKLPAPDGPVLEIASFQFRLAIIQELMYEQEVLEPKFDVYDFAQDRGAHNFDPDEYYDQMIPSVRTWFRKFPIPAALAAQIETLDFDGGNDIYGQLIPQWDGEDESFTIKSLKESDLDLFPSLKSIAGADEFIGPRARKVFEKRGITLD